MLRIAGVPVMAISLVGLAACVGSEAPAPTPAPRTATATPAATGAAGTRFDGTYSGLLGAPSVSGPNTSVCLQSGTQQTLRIANGQLRGGIFFRTFNGPVGADGSFNMTGPDSRPGGNPATIEGRATATNLDGTYTLRVGVRTTCEYSLTGLTRS